MFPEAKCFVVPPNSKVEKTAKKSFAEHDLITCESKVYVVVSKVS